MAIKNPAALKTSRRIATIWVVIALGSAVLIGLVGSAVFPGVLKGNESERIFIELARNLVHPIIAGIILSGILAATMSTSDSQLLITSSAISQNFFKGVLKKDATERQVMWVSRLTIILVAIIAAFMAYDPKSSIFKIVSHA